MEPDRRPIVITGAAGLVGQNLIPRLKARHAGPLIAIDKHPANTKTLARLHPDIRVIEADLAVDGAWRAFRRGMRFCPTSPAAPVMTIGRRSGSIARPLRAWSCGR